MRKAEMDQTARRVKRVEGKLLIGSAVSFFVLAAVLTGGSLVFAALVLAAVSVGCLVHPLAERIVARDLSLYSLLDPPGEAAQVQGCDAPRLDRGEESDS